MGIAPNVIVLRADGRVGSDIKRKISMDVAAVFHALLNANLADGLQERLALNITVGTADFGDDNIGFGAFGKIVDIALDFVGSCGEDGIYGDKVRFCYWRRGLRLGQGHHSSQPGPFAENPRPEGGFSKAGSLYQRGSRHHEPATARRGVRD